MTASYHWQECGPALVVTPLRRLAEAAQRFPDADLLSLSSERLVFDPAFDDGRITALVFNDISAPQSGLVMPSSDHLKAILQAGQRAAAAGRALIVCCFAGISRSTAAAYAIANVRAGPGQEVRLAQDLRRLSPAATPNPAMTATADELLRRQGAMSAAIATIGRGAEAAEGDLFAWPVVSSVEPRMETNVRS